MCLKCILNFFWIIFHIMYVYKCVVSIVWIWFLSLFNRNVYKICIFYVQCVCCAVHWCTMYDVMLWPFVEMDQIMDSYSEMLKKLQVKNVPVKKIEESEEDRRCKCIFNTLWTCNGQTDRQTDTFHWAIIPIVSLVSYSIVSWDYRTVGRI